MSENPLQQFEWICEDDRGKPVSSFIPQVQKKIEVVDTTGVKSFAALELHFKEGESKEVIVPLSDLDHTDWFGMDQRCIFNPRYRNAREYIANLIRICLPTVPTEIRHSYDSLGIKHIDDTIIFVAGDRVITWSPPNKPKPIVEMKKLPFRLDIDPQLDAMEAFNGMRELISLSPEIGRILVAHVISGITRRAFNEAKFVPCAVLVVVGESGMFKSSYVPHMVQLYNRSDEIRPVTRFNSTQSFIEDVLYDYSECTAVIDDLHSAESKGIKRKNEATAEEMESRGKTKLPPKKLYEGLVMIQGVGGKRAMCLYSASLEGM